MTNVEKLTARLNRCHNPRLVYNALLALAPVIREYRETFQGRTDEKFDQEFVSEIAAVVRKAEEAGV